MGNLILASQSPRRKELLLRVCGDFLALPADIDETLPEGISPEHAVLTLSKSKARHIYKAHEGSTVIGADTVVSIENEILNKPENEGSARHMLSLLSGKVHTVYTGVTIIKGGMEKSFAQATRVEFYPLSEELIGWYIKTGEPFDKAGGYGIQEKGAVLVKGIEGDYFNVMGLPIARVWRELNAF